MAWLAAFGAVVFATGGCATPGAASLPASGPLTATKPTVDAAPPQIALVTEEDKTFYALGMLLGRSIGVFQLTPHEFEIVKAGLAEAFFKSRPERVKIEVYGPKVDLLAKANSKEAAVGEKARGDAYRAAVAKEPGAEIRYLRRMAGRDRSAPDVPRRLRPSDGAQAEVRKYRTSPGGRLGRATMAVC